MYADGGTGGAYRGGVWGLGGYREGYTATQHAARGGVHDSEAGPGSPQCGLEWVVMKPGRPTPVNKVLNGTLGTAAGRLLHPPLRGPVGPCGPSLVQDPRNAASQPIRARFMYIYCKVSQNRGVSPIFVEKACHSPYLQNGLRKSALGFLRFPYLRAFSHKELMGHFRPYPYIKCQKDEVSPDVHTPCHARKGRQIPPQSAQQAASADCSSSDSAHGNSAVFSSDP